MSQCLWNEVDIYWNVFEQLWNDVVPCISEIEGYIALGAPPEDAYGKAVRDKKLKRKIIKLILVLKGHTYTQIKEVDISRYKVTAKDINLLLDEYYSIRPFLSVMVENVDVR